MKTNKSALEQLYDALALEFKRQLESDEAVPAATLNVIRQFLNDANVNIAPGTHSVVNEIASTLPFTGAEHDTDNEEHTTH